jgi:prepilin-type N-terminal cleavage/methylation domain-containing protein
MTPRRPRGFSLAETLAVCAVLGVAVAVALPSSQPVSEARADAAAAEVAQALRFAREETLRTGTQLMVRCDTSQNSVSVYQPDTSGNVSQVQNDPLTHMNYAILLDQAPTGAHAALSACSFVFFAGPTAVALAFDASGRPVRGPSSGKANAADALNTGTIQLTLGRTTRTVAIDINGRVTTS